MPPKLATLNSVKKSASADDDDSGDEQGRGAPANFFVGGGQSVIGGPKGGKSAADEIVKKATEAAKAAAAAGGGAGPKGHVTITLYENGFTVKVGEEAEGELRDYDSDASKQFMAAINTGRVPQELAQLPAVRSGDLDVGLSDKRGEKYTAPPYRAFSGSGATVGKPAIAPASAVVRGTGAGAASVKVDSSAPTTRIQVKLFNGKKETVTLNLSHTVGDLQSMVAALNGSNGKPFILTAGFPPKPLDVAAATIEAAGLKNASVTQVAQ